MSHSLFPRTRARSSHTEQLYSNSLTRRLGFLSNIRCVYLSDVVCRCLNWSGGEPLGVFCRAYLGPTFNNESSSPSCSDRPKAWASGSQLLSLPPQFPDVCSPPRQGGGLARRRSIDHARDNVSMCCLEPGYAHTYYTQKPNSHGLKGRRAAELVDTHIL